MIAMAMRVIGAMLRMANKPSTPPAAPPKKLRSHTATQFSSVRKVSSRLREKVGKPCCDGNTFKQQRDSDGEGCNRGHAFGHHTYQRKNCKHNRPNAPDRFGKGTTRYYTHGCFPPLLHKISMFNISSHIHLIILQFFVSKAALQDGLYGLSSPFILC